MKFKEISILEFGNNYTISGVVMEGVKDDENSLIYMLPQKSFNNSNNIIQTLSIEEWNKLFLQLDTLNTEGCDSFGQKIILRKSTRHVDNKVSWQVFRRDNFACRYCNIDNVPMTVDHIITYEKGGPWTKENLLTSCSKCNKKRGNLDYGSWMEHKYYLDKSKYLTEIQKLANDAITRTIRDIPTYVHIKSR